MTSENLPISLFICECYEDVGIRSRAFVISGFNNNTPSGCLFLAHVELVEHFHFVRRAENTESKSVCTPRGK